MAGKALLLDFIEANTGLFRLRDPHSELIPTQTRIDARGDEHVRLEHHYLGVPIWGSQLVGHLDHTGLYALNGRYTPTPDYITHVEPTITSGEAIQRALTDLAQHQRIEPLSPVMRQLLGYENPRADLYLWSPQTETRVRLTWQVEIRASVGQRWRYFIDAHSGDILNHYQAAPTNGPAIGRGIDLLGESRELDIFEEDGQFYLIDFTRQTFDQADYNLGDPKGALWTMDAQSTDIDTDAPSKKIVTVVSADSFFVDPAAVSVHANMALIYDYFFRVHDRLGIFGDGRTMKSVIHVTEGGQPGGAFWDGVQVGFGDGNKYHGSKAASLDIAAHEMTHGIISSTVNLEYLFQSGALDESFADIFAAMVDSSDWLIGEDVVNLEHYPSGAMRDLQNPANRDSSDGFNWQPAHMSEFREMKEDDDNGGVHVNSGIPNHAAYLLAEDIGRDQAARIYYRILDASYLTSRSQFVDCRLAAERAARDLFGDDAPQLQAVRDAYDAVGIAAPGESEEPPGTDDQANHWIAAVAAEVDGDNSLWLAKPVSEPDQSWDIAQLTPTQVYAETGNAVTAPLNGDFLLFIDSDNSLRYIGLDGTEEEVINDEGDWNSIALSPDGTKLAATTIFGDPMIYYFDLDDPANNREVKLWHWTKDGPAEDIALYADALQWDATSTFIIYDVYNSLPGPGDKSFDFWEINKLNPVDESGRNLFPPQPEGIHLANPSLSSRVRTDGSIDDCRLIYERFDEKNEKIQILVSDLCTGEEAELYTIAGTAFTFPHFTNNDREIVFEEEWLDENGISMPALWRLKLDKDSLRAVGDPYRFVPNAQSPYSFIVESDAVVQPTAVEEEAGAPVSRIFALRQNFPNPFNSDTVIHFALPASGEVELAVYNLVGQQVVTLVNGVRAAGAYAVQWDGRDDQEQDLASGLYFYRLQAGPQVETRKLLLLR